jgi:hypothetical protein
MAMLQYEITACRVSKVFILSRFTSISPHPRTQHPRILLSVTDGKDTIFSAHYTNPACVNTTCIFISQCVSPLLPPGKNCVVIDKHNLSVHNKRTYCVNMKIRYSLLIGIFSTGLLSIQVANSAHNILITRDFLSSIGIVGNNVGRTDKEEVSQTKWKR